MRHARQRLKAPSSSIGLVPIYANDKIYSLSSLAQSREKYRLVISRIYGKQRAIAYNRSIFTYRRLNLSNNQYIFSIK